MLELQFNLGQFMEVVDALLCADFELGNLVPRIVIDLHARWENQLDISIYMVHYCKLEGGWKVLFQYPPDILDFLLAIFVHAHDLNSPIVTFPLASLSSL